MFDLIYNLLINSFSIAHYSLSIKKNNILCFIIKIQRKIQKKKHCKSKQYLKQR